MTFFEFYSSHFISLTLIFFVIAVVIVFAIVFLIKKLIKSNKVKTPWFEIAPDSVNTPESEDMGKTRLLIKRQMEFVDNFINGIQSILQAVEKEVIEDALKVLFKDDKPPKTHMTTCLIQSSTNELVKELKNYLNSLLVINHIGTNKEKIQKYAKGHVCQLIGIAKKYLSDSFSRLSGEICLDVNKYWVNIGIKDTHKWVEEELCELLFGLSELRYSDFDETNDEE